MRTLHRYLTRQVLAALALTVIVFTFVLLLANVLKEILALLISGQATLGLVAEAIALLVPFVMTFSLPLGMLTATLLVFGRFSADQELTAVRAGGVSLVALVTPVLLLSVVLSAVSALVNMQIAPRCRVAYKNLVFRVGQERPASLIVEDRVMDDFRGYIVYVGKKEKSILYNVWIYKLGKDGTMESRHYAARAHIVSVDPASNRVELRLQKVHYQDFVNWEQVGYAEEWPYTLDFKAPDLRQRAIPLHEMTIDQLLYKLRQLEQIDFHSKPAEGLTADQLREQKGRIASAKADLTSPVRVQIHRQVAFSFACIGFTLIGIPLGIRAHRRETTVGFAMAILLAPLYYGFVFLGLALDTRPEFAPHLILWLPNFIFQAIGVVLLWRANRGQ